jgi:transposase InsO family protein
VAAVCSQWDVSIRRGCRLLGIDTSSYHYSSRRPGQAGLEQRIKEIAATRVRYGYRRVHVLLRREGWPINQKKNAADLSRVRSATAQQNTETPGQGQAAGRSSSGNSLSRDLGDGLRA